MGCGARPRSSPNRSVCIDPERSVNSRYAPPGPCVRTCHTMTLLHFHDITSTIRLHTV